MKWARKAAALLAVVLILTGCAPHKELKELSIVEGLGIDMNTDGSYFLTFQVLKTQTGKNGGSGQGGSSSQEEIIQGSGASLFDASRNVTMHMGKKLYYSTVSSLVFGREICAGHLSEMLDFLERNHEINPSERVFMADGKASDILTAQDSSGYISAHDIRLLSQNNYNTSKVVDQRLEDLLLEDGMGQDVYLAVLSAQTAASGGQASGGKSTGGSSGGGGGSGSQSSSGSSNQTVVATGTAIFHQKKLVGILTPEQTRGMLWVLGQVKSGILVIPTESYGDVSMEIRNESTQIRPEVKNGQASVKVDIRMETSLAEVETTNKLTVGQPVLDQLIDAQNRKVRSEVESAIEAALRKNNADIFGFGLRLYESEPAVWRRMSGQWATQAGRLPISVNVQSTISSNGLIVR